MSIKLDVTLRRPSDYDTYEQRIKELEDKLLKREKEIYHMSKYADFALRLTDQLQEVRRRLDALGEDTSFIKIR